MNSIINERQSKYCDAIIKLLNAMGHASNAELLESLRITYPKLSATTVHRVTTRLAKRDQIKTAPPKKDGSIRYDSNLTEHDHFLCSSCDLLIDTDIKDRIIPIIKSSIKGCEVNGRLTISGICKKCKTIKKEKNNENNNL